MKERKRRLGLTDISAATGVSIATVSRALSRPHLVQPQTLRRIQRAVSDLGYLPRGAARALASGRTLTIGAVVPTLDHAIFARAIQSLQSVLVVNDYRLLIGTHEYSPLIEEAAVRSMLTHGVDALVLVGADHLDRTWDLLASASVPVLLTWSFDSRFPSIWFDNEKAGRIAAEHLLSLGHQRFGMISGHRRWNDRARLRVEGVRTALADRGHELAEWAIIDEPFTLAGGRDGMMQLLAAAQPPTAIVCGNDLLAAGAMFEAFARGQKVPEQVSLVGIDNLELAAHLSPALTTVHLPTVQLGEQAGQLLVNMLRNEPFSANLQLPIELVVRRSSGPPPA